jgi:hypothetical protein
MRLKTVLISGVDFKAVRAFLTCRENAASDEVDSDIIGVIFLIR